MSTADNTVTSIVFVDGSLTDIDAILSSVAQGTAVFILDPAQDALTQMATIAAAYSGLSAIHLLSHGGTANLSLGGTILSSDNLADYADQLAIIGGALAASGDLLLYGCDVGKGDEGQAFIEQLAQLTGADVAASTDLTGNADAGGNWLLEATTGAIEASAITADGYAGTLASYYGTTGNDTLTGGATADYLYGYAGNDYLNGGAGNDTMYGSTGNDVYYVDSSADSVVEYAGEGTDWVYSSGTYYSIYSAVDVENLYVYGATVGYTYYGYGNEGANSIQANSGASATNYFYGYGGNDTIYGYAGDDTLYGAAGNDTLLGGADNDTLYGGTENDYLAGGSENDYLDGSSGLDTLYGEAGTDTLYGGADNDYLSGGTANDYLDAGAGADTLYGDAGQDILYGGSENDYLSGGTESDTLDGGSGNDTLFGGSGDDTYVVDSASDSVTEYASEGTDTLQTGLTTTLGSNLENLTLTGAATINATGNTLNNVLTGNSGNNVLDGGSGNDTMDGGAGNDSYYVDSTLDATSETDSLTGGTDTVYASTDHAIGSGIENLILTGSAYSGTGNVMANTLTGNASSNSLQGLSGNDTLLGYDGIDYLDGGADADSLVGGLGDDYYYVDNASDTVVENAGEGNDWVYAYLNYTLQTDFENLYLVSGSTASGNEVGNTLWGNGSANTLYGNGGNDNIWANSGNDTLYGGNGNDTLDGSSGADSMNGGDYDDIYYVDDVGDIAAESYNDALGGVDTVYATASHTLGFGIEHLTLDGSSAINGTGNSNANRITGNSGSNIVYGLAGNDTLDGGSGADTLYGGADNDTYTVDNASDVVSENAGEGADTVQSSLNWTLGGNIENLTLTGSAAINGTGNTLDNYLTGNSGNNTLDGGSGADTLDGGAGSDTLTGGLGNDVFVVDSTADSIADSSGTDRIDSSVSFDLTSALVTGVENLTLTGSGNVNATGNASANVLTGNAGNNRLDGGSGSDTLAGGAGNDTYVVNTALDIVTENSGEGTDTVETSVTLSLANYVENLTLTGATHINGTGNSLANVLTGNSGNNILDGGTGADSMSGGAGSDTYVVDDSGDVIGENSGEGSDSVLSSAAAYVLSANLENLTLTGSDNIAGSGNSGANNLTGNSGDNLLSGDLGDDTIDGGLGEDTVVLAGNQAAWTVNVSGSTATITNTGTGESESLQRVEWLQFDDGTVQLVMGQSLTGDAGNNPITGGAGNDTINGAAGADTMTGGAGDDYYFVDDGGDVVTEYADEGYDWVYSYLASYTLGSDIENLYVLGGAGSSGTGNGADNNVYGYDNANTLDGVDGNDYLYGGGGDDTLYGGAGNDVLNGAAGNDSMDGGAGDDIYYVDDALDVTSDSGGGTDDVYASLTHTVGAGIENLTLTGSGNIDGTGNSGANYLTGNGGDNALDGGTGADTLAGGSGNDGYVVDNAGDVIIEYAGQGTDAVDSSITYTLSGNVENLTLTGSGNIDGTGNSGANSLTGNSGNNVLDGGAGADTLSGAAGNDTYRVDDAGDSVVESSGEGTDLVESSVSHGLSDDVENLTLTGAGDIDGSGNSAANLLTGNTGDNTLSGLGGNDTLQGGAGDDSLAGGTGNDLLAGGTGSNTAVYTGNVAAYQFGVDAYGTITVSGEGIDRLDQIQQISFADTELTVASAGQNGEVEVAGFAAGYATTPSVAMLSAGGYVVSWEQGYQVYMQRYDALGAEVGGAIAVGTYAYDSDITALVDGGYAVCYYGYESDGSGYAIRAKTYDAAGNETGSAVLSTGGGWDTSITALSGGGYVATWSLYSGGAYDVHTVVVDGDGNVGSETVVTLGGDQYYPAVTATADGGFALTWYDNGHPVSQRFDASGTATTSAATVGDYGYAPAIVGLNDGGYIVFWQGYDGNYDGVIGQRYDAAGAAAGSSFVVNATVDLTQASPSVAATPDGGFVVVWESDGQDGSDYGIFGRRFAADGSAVGEEFQVNATTLYGQRAPDVAVGSDGSFVVTWRSEGAGGGVFSQRFTADGTKIGGISITGGAAAESISAAGALQSAVLAGEGGNDSLTGGAAADTLAGGSGDDTLSGGAGTDSLQGGAGDDVYIVASGDADDAIVENDNEGDDQITSAIDYVLPESSIEKLVLTDAATTGEGNTLSNTLIGNNLANTLTGAGGDDTLEGGRGNDKARFSGDLAEYVFGVDANGAITVRHAAVSEGGDGTDVLDGIQTVQFANATVTIDTLAAVNTANRVNSQGGWSAVSTSMALADGSTLVVWQGSEGGVSGLFAQRVDERGQPLGSVVTVGEFPATGSTYLDNNQIDLVRCGEGYAVVWTTGHDADSGGPGGYEYEIFGRRLGADGAVVGTDPFSIAPAEPAGSSYLHVEVSELDAGGFTVLYSQNGSYPYPLVAVNYDGSGNETSTTPLTTTQPYAFTALADGGYLVMSGDSAINANMPGGWEYWTEAQRYTAAGVAVGNPFQLNDAVADSWTAEGVEVCVLGNGDMLAAWSIYNGSNYDIAARVYSPSGNDWVAVNVAEIDVTGGTAFDQSGMQLAALPGGGFVITWTHTSSSQADVYARVFANDGSAATDVFIVNSVVSGYQTAPSISVADDGSFTIFYNDSGLYAQHYDADGRKIGGVELTGTGSGDTLKVGDAVQSVHVLGLAGNDSLAGGAVADTLEGGTGNDTLDGASGLDSLLGGYGNDTYVYDGSGDSFVEAEGQGVDSVLASASYTLAETSIENITLVAGALDAVGNARANTLTGNAQDNELDGKAGNDAMIGGAGNDTYVVDASGDVVSEGSNGGSDTIRSSIGVTALAANVEILELTGSDDLQGSGNGLNNTIYGNAGSNLLEGRQGDDIYVIDATDTVLELSDEGNDTIRIATASYSLAGAFEVENLEFTGAGGATGTGNASDNRLLGNVGNDSLDGGSGNDTLTGAAGSDTLTGGTGDDSFEVDNATDQTIELADGGSDTVRAGVSYTLSSDATYGFVENLLLTGGTSINGTGNGLANTLTGNAANNVLNGGSGADSLLGGAGNDSYVVDNVLDVVSELSGQGTDTVQASVSISALAAQVENLTLTGAAALNGTGNTLNNTLTGNSAANVLDGGSGADTLIGGNGNDIYVVDDVGDVVTEASGAGTDTVRTSLTSFVLPDFVEKLELTGTTALDAYGNALDNTVTGNSLNNVLDGDAGNDTLLGGKGDDFYYVDSLADVVTENFGEGSDTLFTTVSGYILAKNVEYLKLLGSANINGTGNSLSNIIEGNSGNNILDGGAFVDVMIGLGGNDTYKVDSTEDDLVEESGEGTDIAYASVTYTLPDEVENLTLEATSNINGTGNSLGNILLGNAGANVLYGLAGADTLNGGSGNDSLAGGDGNDSLLGSLGNDTLDGGLGLDAMAGGAGDDTYRVDNAGDVVSELAGEGSGDLVESTISYTLVGNVEHLLLQGSANLYGTGNTLSNQIIGNSGNNLLSGLAGDDLLKGNGGRDTLVGSSGNDLYYVDSLDDVVTELSAEGTDVIYAVGGAGINGYVLPNNVENINYFDVNFLYAVGNSLNNYFTGNDGDNILNGAGGNDTMAGGDGNDTYYVGESGDLCVESSSEGTDSVIANLSYSLAANLENLTLGGTAASGTGNNLANQINGNAANNTLNGGAGADTLGGGAGNDIYIVDSSSDVVVENGSEGTDRVLASGNFILGNNIEEVELTGYENINATGNTGDNLLIGNGGNNVLAGGDGIDTVTYNTATRAVTVNLSSGQSTGNGSDTLVDVENLTGSAYADSLAGDTADNTFDGGVGRDTMAGGAGNDVYYVDDVLDVVTETDNNVAAGGASGINLGQYAGALDFVHARVSFTLGSYIENLLQVGVANLTGIGNELNNSLAGNSGNNLLKGMAGNDTISGGLGDDTLDGGAGSDSLTGGAGNDVYYVDSTAGDKVIESASAGTDTVYTTVDFVLGGNLENLRINTATGRSIIGNTLNNALYGNNGNDQLNGGSGVDTMTGGLGDDVYSVDVSSDSVVEAASAGTDTVYSYLAAHTLASNVENGRIVVSTTASLTGNTLANTLYAGAGNNVLNGGSGTDTASYLYAGAAVAASLASISAQATGGSGSDTFASIENLFGSNYNDRLTGSSAANTLAGGAGNDTLTGGAAADSFLFDKALSATTNLDTISDFSVIDDTIRLENAVFTKLTAIGALSSANFVRNATGRAVDSNDYLIYETDTGKLFYDADGSGSGAAIQFAKLTTGLTMTSADFWVV